jgi:hypothetical protein
LVGDKTSVSVAPDKIYNGNQPGADASVGDTVEFYVNGGVDETYPTQCSAWKIMILSKAAANNDVLDDPAQELPPESSNPYFVLFKQMFTDDPGLNGDIKYIAVDLTGVLAEDNTGFLALMNAFCNKEDLTLLEDSVDGLIEKGLVKDSYFEEGIVIEFDDTELTDSKLVTDARKWRSGLGAIGGTFTLEKQGGVWSITETENQWIS